MQTLEQQQSALGKKTSLVRGGKTERAAASLTPISVSTPPPERTLKRMVREDQIRVLTFDRPGSGANIFDRRTLVELEKELEFIAGSPHLKGLVLTSAKPSIFVAGADLRAMSEAASPEEVRELVELGQRVMDRLASLPIPTAAAIHGAAVGGGYELCLACDYRVASNDRVTKIGLPETQLGLLPAWGGSTRLPRLVGLPKALDVILAGKTLAPKQALKYGMVDELAPQEYLVEVAVRMLKAGKARPQSHWRTNNRIVATALAMHLRAKLLKKTRGHYPAVLKALEVVTRGVSKSIPESLALERMGILELAQTEACRNLVGMFFLQERAKKLVLDVEAGFQPASNGRILASDLDTTSGRDAALLAGWKPASTNGASAPKPVALTAVIGAGVMGAGIAQWLSARRLRVILKDISTEQVAKGIATISKLYRDGQKRHVFTPLEARDGMDRISPAPGVVPLSRVDLVIEAAVENLELKKKIFQALDESVGDHTILATNTSALPVSELAATTRRPERVIGLHFFNPVHRMQLVEIVAARQTSPEVLQRALCFVQQIGKLPVIVKDSPGFLVNRILMPYLIAAGSLFEAGFAIEDIDEAMLDFGMPMGPLRLLDEVGIDVALRVAQTLAGTYRDRVVLPETLSRMVQAGLLGRKTGRGFYLYPKSKDPRPNPAITPRASRLTRRASQVTDLQSRMVFLMLNEAARCLEEEVVTEPADVDFAMIMGTGFAPFRGGPLRYADTLGISTLVSAMERLVEQGSPEFEPCALLRSMATAGKTFYPARAK
ncbi:MAG TPA: 3-hydroxyacyl-CoA dehydrogenase NAD-binding domain-containing protein [Candidatus Binatia bacterium]|jgi:3-hydroxyacyl-CoA dehydrogenase/enoyl-CoA hydratase/3-hydroxybutyryl-CoA epimerase|nr:3-hydroxyacyl-CoA dehydrogenase NAD-binding domain-containing protein [Candidatus Binatia bacterium]